MTSWKLDTPVVFIIFNRPETTWQVFNVIRQVRPRRLLVIADGPRQEIRGEAEACAKTRAIIDHVDWNCTIETCYSDFNLGVPDYRISTGLNWAFNQVEQAIILEDDCLPDLSFFEFCSALLEKYRNNHKIASIHGCNRLETWKSNDQSYHYVHFGNAWGWATWSHKWQDFKYQKGGLQWQDKSIRKMVQVNLNNDVLFNYWSNRFEWSNQSLAYPWDYQWFIHRLSRGLLSVVPSVNLIRNIGFRPDATHTNNEISCDANLATFSLSPPFLSPNKFEVDDLYDLVCVIRLTCHYFRLAQEAVYLVGSHRYSIGLEKVNLALLARPDLIGLKYEKAFAEYKLGQVAAAKTTLTELLKAIPSHSKASCLLSSIHNESNEQQQKVYF